MNNFYTFLVNLVQALTPIFVIGCSALFIYKQVDGWGWFLFLTILILSSWNFKPEPYTPPPPKEPFKDPKPLFPLKPNS